MGHVNTRSGATQRRICVVEVTVYLFECVCVCVGLCVRVAVHVKVKFVCVLLADSGQRTAGRQQVNLYRLQFIELLCLINDPAEM